MAVGAVPRVIENTLRVHLVVIDVFWRLKTGRGETERDLFDTTG